LLLLVVPLLWLVDTKAFGPQPAGSQITEVAAQALKLEQTGQFEEALALRQKAYDLSVQQYGEKDLHTLAALNTASSRRTGVPAISPKPWNCVVMPSSSPLTPCVGITLTTPHGYTIGCLCTST
jgi:hypothetical protein